MPTKKNTPSPDDPEVLEAFRKLFWAARKSHRKNRQKAVESDSAHREAVQFAKKHALTWAGPLLQAILCAYRAEAQSALDMLVNLEVPELLGGEKAFTLALAHYYKTDYDAAITCYYQALEFKGFGNPGYAWYGIGVAHDDKKDYDSAIECYRKALESPGYDTPGYAWYNMGLAQSGKENYDAAIDCFHKALGSPGFDTPGSAWYGIGIAQYGKKDYDASIESYRKALTSPGYDTPGDAWNNMGLVYDDKKDHHTAIDCFRRALESPGYDTPHLTRVNLAIALKAVDKLAEAKREIQAVLDQPNSEGQHGRARLLLSMLESAERGFQPDAEEEALAAPTPPSLKAGPEERMKDALIKRKTRYDEYLAKSVQPAPDGLSILRGWSSSVTLLEGGQDCQWSGGGYFLKWREKGLVIDPGFDFLDNFHQAGFHATDIHAVVVSHNHPDHNADLNPLNALCYEIARAKTDTPKFLFAMDEDTAERFGHSSEKHRGYPHKFTGFDHDEQRWLKPEGLPFSIEHFPVSHGTDVPRAIGMRLRLLANDRTPVLTIGYTGDGGFTPELAKHLKGVDLLIAHVSQPDSKEFNNPEHLKDIHLGYNGAVRLIKEVQPKLTLIGEFWAGLADLRLDLIDGIRLRSGSKSVFPACLGLYLSLPDLNASCFRCGELVPTQQIRIAPPLKEFGLLGYLCDQCIL